MFQEANTQKEITEREYYEKMLDGCETILNAETEEEVEAAREGITAELTERFGYNEADIDEYMTRVERWVELAETGEMTTDEMSNMINEQFPETESLTEAQNSVAPVIATGVGSLGIGLGIFAGICKLKKKTLNNKQNRSR